MTHWARENYGFVELIFFVGSVALFAVGIQICKMLDRWQEARERERRKYEVPQDRWWENDLL